MNFVKASNFIVNSLMLPGMFLESSYTYDDFPYIDLMASPEQQRIQEANRPDYTSQVKYADQVIRTKQTTSYPLRLVFVPVDFSTMLLADRLLNSPGSHIPAVLQICPRNKASTFIIHFHGNACDAAQVGAPARVESRMFNAHYLVVEYPGYGIASGASSETMLNSIAFSAYLYVVRDLGVPPEKVVIYGRSVGCGLAVHLAAKLQALGQSPAAVILHSPYTSIKDVAKDVMGKSTLLFMNRWENWKLLCQKPSKRDSLASPRAPSKSTPSERASKSTDAKISVHTSSGVGSESIEVTVSASSHVMTATEIARLLALYDACTPATIEAPVLFIHADHDQIIDHHHSATLNLGRSRNGCSTELFTQRSNEIFQKDHNMFDYEVDVINPIRAFLKKHNLLTTSATSDSYMFTRTSQMSAEEYTPEEFVSLNLSDVSCATLPPRQHLLAMLRTRDVRARISRKIAEKEAEAAKAAKGATPATAAASASADKAASTTEAGTPAAARPSEQPREAPKQSENKDGPGSLLGLICNGWNSMKCIRCCICCVPCFCCECNASCSTAACNGIYYSLCDDEPDFEYTSRAQRRQSGGLKVPENRNSLTDRNSIGALHTIQPPTIQQPTEKSPEISSPTQGNEMDRGDVADKSESDDGRHPSSLAVLDCESPSSSDRTDSNSDAGFRSPSGRPTEPSITGFFSRPFDQQNTTTTSNQLDAMESIGAEEMNDGETTNPLQKNERRKSSVPIYLPG